MIVFFFSSRRRHTRWPRDWSSDVCSSDLLGPGRLVGGSHLTGNITGHLCRQVIDGTHVCIRLLLQPFLFALLAMGKCVAAHRVQGVAVGQLGLAQGLELVMA